MMAIQFKHIIYINGQNILYQRAMMALNRSPEFKKSNQKPSAAELFGTEITIRANSEELYYAILYIKFQVSEPMVLKQKVCFYITYAFLCFKFRSPWRKGHFGPSDLGLNKLVKGPLHLVFFSPLSEIPGSTELLENSLTYEGVQWRKMIE